MTTPGEQPLAMPEADDVEQASQRETATLPVRIEGPTLTHELPARLGVVQVLPLTTTPQRALYADLKRRRAVLICTDAALLISRSGSGEFATWPQNMALTLFHADEIYAKVASGTGTLTVITEIWAE